MKTKLILIAGLTGLLLLFGNARATIVTIGIEATVTYVRDFDNLLEGQITKGSLITGYYTYNTDTPDTDSSDSLGSYWHYTSPYGIFLICNDFVFATDQSDPEFLISIGNDEEPLLNDFYGLWSHNNLNILDDVSVDYILWQLDDYSGNAIDSTSLTGIPPVLNNWTDRGINITIEREVFISADVTSVFFIPEPSTLMFLMMGGVISIKRIKRTQ